MKIWQALRAVMRDGKRVKDKQTGEIWERNIGHDRVNFPLIIAGCSTGSSIEHDFVVLKPKKKFRVNQEVSQGKDGERVIANPAPKAWLKGEVRWQKGSNGMVLRFDREYGCLVFFRMWTSTQNFSSRWDTPRGATFIDITREEALELIHEMGWNEDGTKWNAPTVEDLRESIGKYPRVGDGISLRGGLGFELTVRAVSPELVAYEEGGGFDAVSRQGWLSLCRAALSASRMEKP